MKQLITTIAASLGLFLAATHAQIVVLSDFSNFTAEGPSFDASWMGGTPSVPQFIQGAGFISIQSVNGGNPQDDGSVIVPLAATLNLSGLSTISITARQDTGNAAPIINVTLFDSSFNTAFATFSTASFGPMFSNQQLTITENPGFDSSSVVAYQFGGGNFVGVSNFRLSLDSLTVIPEPTSATLVLIGIGILGVLTKRRRCSN